MSAIGDLLARFLGPWIDQPLLASILGGIATLIAVAVASRAAYRLLASLASRLSPGPVFVFGALVVGLAYAILLGYFRAVGKSFEEGVLAWLAGVTSLPLEGLGIFTAPMLLTFFYTAIQAIYLAVVLLAAWLVGATRDGGGEGSVAQEIEQVLGTSYAMQFYRLCGYHRPDAPEKRFHDWAAPLVKATGWLKWLCLPAVYTGSVPVAAWVVGAVLHDGLKRNLTPPPSAPEEEKRAEEQAQAAPPLVKDTDQLIRALRDDPRGPQLDIMGGGQLPGRLEHGAEKTRLRDESQVFADALAALGIEDFYVHQEAASEAILSGEDVLMETPPLSGRRTLCDVLAMREVLLQGGTALYLSPTRAESARRAKAFAAVAQASNWRWAIFHHELSRGGREGIDLKLRQPQILFLTPEELHRDLCPRHRDWDYFLQSLSLVVAIDLDRYTGPRGANLMFLMRRLARVVSAAGAEPRFLATVAPYGPDVQGFSERLLGRPLTVIGPESDSRGAPTQYVLVGRPRVRRPLHPAVESRGVAIACGYQAEIWGHGDRLTDFETDQQVNKVLLEFGRAVVSVADDTDLRFDDADAIVVRLSAEKAAMVPFFTRHVGRDALGIAALKAMEVGTRRVDAEGPALPFGGFQRFAEEVDLGKKEKVPDADEVVVVEESPPEEPPADGEAPEEQAPDPIAQLQSDMAVAMWLPDDDAFAQLLARNPGWVHPQALHPMLERGAMLVASPDNAAITLRHLLCAAAETPITRTEAAQKFCGAELSVAALDALVHGRGDEAGLDLSAFPERLLQRHRLDLDDEGHVQTEEELLLEGELLSRGSTRVGALRAGRLENRSGGEIVLELDAERLMAAAYPGRVLISGGRRYRVLLPDEQRRLDEDVAWCEPERRRVVTDRIRRLDFSLEGEGHALKLGGEAPARYLHGRVILTEEVIGLRSRHPGRGEEDALLYDAPVTARYPTRVTALSLPPASPEAQEGLERLVRVVLPAFLKHEEEDLDVWVGGEPARLCFVDRHPGGAGFARAVSADTLRHVLFWVRHLARCGCEDGCPACVEGAPSFSESRRASRRATSELVTALLGET